VGYVQNCVLDGDWGGEGSYQKSRGEGEKLLKERLEAGRDMCERERFRKTGVT